jgi:hypothetical protein
VDNVVFPDEEDDWTARGRRAVAADPEDDLDAHAFLDEDDEAGEGEWVEDADEVDDDPQSGRRRSDQRWSEQRQEEPGWAPAGSSGRERRAAGDASGEEASPPRRVRGGFTHPRAAADQILDELLPEQLDWQRLVRQYPIPSLAVAALGGYLLGRYKGAAVLAALSAFAADAVAENVNEILGDELI